MTGALFDDSPLLEDVGIVSDLQRLAGILVDQQNGHTLLIDLDDEIQNLTDQKRGQPQGRLIYQQHAGLCPSVPAR